MANVTVTEETKINVTCRLPIRWVALLGGTQQLASDTIIEMLATKFNDGIPTKRAKTNGGKQLTDAEKKQRNAERRKNKKIAVTAKLDALRAMANKS